jgi:hypothetical protein
MAEVSEQVETKVRAIFQELAGDRSQHLFATTSPAAAQLADAITPNVRGGGAASRDIAFHLSDWSSDAAFLVAVHLYPERFTREEIDAGVEMFLGHAPNHIAAAAKLYGYPVSDVFGIGAC